MPDTGALNDTSDIDARIAAEHAAIDEAYEHGQDGVAEWYARDIDRLSTLRRVVADGSPTVDALLRMRLRGLTQRYARACWAEDTTTAARLLAEIERLERGQL